MAIVKSKLLKQLSNNYPNFLKKDLEKFTNIILNEIKKALKRGDKVITSGGILGTVERIIDNEKVEVKISDNVNVEVVRATGIQSLVSSIEPKK